ncbi:MAG: FAD-dependent oxidoreductase [Legionellaceae bacterium]|nr:FAD-dependent oxidoreductase [Legionellaceae bacterium]
MSKKIYDWAIVGAGPAGIAAVGRLLDQGIHSSKILWIDPYFTVGDLGRLWKNVSSNTKVQLFLDFLYASPSFAYSIAPCEFKINSLPRNETCLLHHIVEPLQWVTNRLLESVHSERMIVHTTILSDRSWLLEGSSTTYRAKNVILATGALPQSLNYPAIKTIPFEDAIDNERLQKEINLDKTYAVFGSSHSAIIIIQNLVNLGVKKIINFYRSPCCYALDMDDWILFDNTGLKGHTAEWARQYIDGIWPTNLERYTSIEPNIARYLPQCDKAIYAVGFRQRNSIILGNYEHINYNPHVGIIGPGLFGFGIAYPEKKTDPSGSIEMQVGLWKFMTYLNKVLPIWLKYHT